MTLAASISLMAGHRLAGGRSFSSTSDSALVEEVRRSGSKEAFGLLVERYRERVFRLLASILGPGFEAEAEDLTQDVFVQVYRKLPGFRGASRFATWLYRVARNAGLDRKRRARFRLPHLGEEALAGRASGDDPYASAADGEGRRAVRAAVEELTEPARTAVYLRYWMECSVAEIADYLDLKEGTVKSHLYRARQRLASRLEESR